MGSLKVDRGQYYCTDPRDPHGEPKYFTRVSNLAGTLDNTYNLDRWNERMAIKGLTKRKDLYELAKATPTREKKKLDGIVRDAKRAMETDSGANLGTAFHSWTERHDRGEVLEEAGPETLRRLDLYSQTLKEAGIEIIPDLMERAVFNGDVEAVGRLDRVALHENELKVCDIKTQKDRPGEWDAVRLAIQQACYNHSGYMWHEDIQAWGYAPDFTRAEALIIWMPVDYQGVDEFCEIIRVDTSLGWQYAELARQVRKARYLNKETKADLIKSIGRGEPAPRDWEAEFLASTSTLELNRLGRECLSSGQITDHLKLIARNHRESLEAG